MIIHEMQQRSDEWYQIRLAKVTSKRFKSIVAPKGDKLKIIDRLIAESVSGQSTEDDFISEEMQRGIDMEPLAKRYYENVYGMLIMDVGFLQSSTWEDLGVSADGLIGKYGAVEIKCPDTHTHVKYIREDKLPDEHKYQTLSYFVVHEELDWVDFISFDPRFTVQPMFVKRVTRESVEKELCDAIIKVDQFFEDYEETKYQIIFGSSNKLQAV